MTPPVITLEDYFMGRDLGYPLECTPAVRSNALITITRVNLLLAKFRLATGDTELRRVTSGWRPSAINASTVGAAARSRHMTGEAIDLADPDGDFDQWCFTHPAVLAEARLWQEHPASTKGWCHLQIMPPKSGNRCFYP